MAIGIYRRHRRECKAGHPEELRTSEYDECKKGFRRCECPIFISGTLRGKFRRQNTGLWEWDAARTAAGQFEATGSWSADPVNIPAEPVDVSPKRVPIAEATEAYLARCQGRDIRATTYSKYKTFVHQLPAFAERHGYVCLDQLGVADMDLFYGSWKDGTKAKSKKLDRLKSFVKFCVKRKWLAEDIASDLQAPTGSSITRPKAPFTDKELNRIYEACDRFGAPAKRNWTGEDAKDFIYLSIYTGLRISDVATFDLTTRLDGNNVFIRTHQNNANVYTWIPDWLVNRLRARVKNHGAMIFKCGVSHTMKQLTDI